MGERWFAPRVPEGFDEDLCDDAQALVDEAERRTEAIAEERKPTSHYRFG